MVNTLQNPQTTWNPGVTGTGLNGHTTRLADIFGAAGATQFPFGAMPAGFVTPMFGFAQDPVTAALSGMQNPFAAAQTGLIPGGIYPAFQSQPFNPVATVNPFAGFNPLFQQIPFGAFANPFVSQFGGFPTGFNTLTPYATTPFVSPLNAVNPLTTLNPLTTGLNPIAGQPICQTGLNTLTGAAFGLNTPVTGYNPITGVNPLNTINPVATVNPLNTVYQTAATTPSYAAALTQIPGVNQVNPWFPGIVNSGIGLTQPLQSQFIAQQYQQNLLASQALQNAYAAQAINAARLNALYNTCGTTVDPITGTIVPAMNTIPFTTWNTGSFPVGAVSPFPVDIHNARSFVPGWNFGGFNPLQVFNTIPYTGVNPYTFGSQRVITQPISWTPFNPVNWATYATNPFAATTLNCGTTPAIWNYNAIARTPYVNPVGFGMTTPVIA